MAQPGSAPAWHAGGQGFESPWIHKNPWSEAISKSLFKEFGMASRHLLGTSDSWIAGTELSGRLTHLSCMDSYRVVALAPVPDWQPLTVVGPTCQDDDPVDEGPDPKR